jgi:hypothetical protein
MTAPKPTAVGKEQMVVHFNGMCKTLSEDYGEWQGENEIVNAIRYLIEKNGPGGTGLGQTNAQGAAASSQGLSQPETALPVGKNPTLGNPGPSPSPVLPEDIRHPEVVFGPLAPSPSPISTEEALERAKIWLRHWNNEENPCDHERNDAALAHLKALAEENKRLRDAVMRFIYGQLWPLTKEQAEAVDDLRAALKCRANTPSD